LKVREKRSIKTIFYHYSKSAKKITYYVSNKIRKEKKMNLNMGIIDRVVRALLAITVAVLIILQILTGVAAIILGIFAAIFLVTSIIGTCPAYLPFKFSTKKKS